MKKKVFKVLSIVILVFSLITLTSCISSTDTLQFESLPKSLYDLDIDSAKNNVGDVTILINGKSYSLNEAKNMGAIVTGDVFTLEGNNTLVIKYGNSTITYTYYVGDKLPVYTDYDVSWYNPDKVTSEADPYLISSVKQLQGLAAIVNGTVSSIIRDNFEGEFIRLTANLDLEGVVWTPIGEGNREESVADATSFKGVFDGDNHTISNLSDKGYVPAKAADYTRSSGESIKGGYTYGLFGNIDGATIKNIKLSNVSIEGKAFSIKDSIVTEYIADSVGGISGSILTGANRCFIEYCSVSGEISAYDAVAGIVGRTYSDCNFINCTNNATISVTGISKPKAGGITAITSTSNSKLYSIFFKCINNGIITSTKDTYTDDNNEVQQVSKNFISSINGVCNYEEYFKDASDPNKPTSYNSAIYIKCENYSNCDDATKYKNNSGILNFTYNKEIGKNPIIYCNVRCFECENFSKGTNNNLNIIILTYQQLNEHLHKFGFEYDITNDTIISYTQQN